MMTEAPIIGGYEGRMQEVFDRAKELETQGARRMREATVAESIVGRDAGEPDEIIMADGSGGPVQSDAEREPLFLGYHVQPKDADSTIADAFQCDPSETIYQVTFPSESSTDLEDLTRYPYPRSMLEYKRGVKCDGGEDNTDDEWIENDNGNTVPRQSEPADFGGDESTGVQDL